MAGATWTLRLTARGDRLPGGDGWLPFAVTGGGLSLTALLAALVWVLATRGERARAQVRAATAELRAGEAEIRRQAELLQAVLDGISDGVTVVDADGAVVLTNPAARQILGRARDSDGVESWQRHYGLYLPDGVTPLPAERIPLVRAMAGEPCDHVEVHLRNPAHPEGRVLSMSARPLTMTGRRGAVAVFHDITERKLVENELRGFAGVVAHDLKSPLTSVLGYTDMIVEALEDAGSPGAVELAQRSAGRVIGAAGRMQRLITELLDYTAARDATLRPADVDLRAIVDDVVSARTDDVTGREQPDVFVGPLPYVHADPVLLRQVVDNLVGNAVKYTPPGRPARIDVTAHADGADGVRVQVADRGIGIPDGEHGTVFDSFHRASNGAAHPGTGLGLAICRRIVERHGGHIEAAPNPGGGTIFAFTVPRGAAAGEAARGQVYQESVGR